jgi:hypothetical protein
MLYVPPICTLLVNLLGAPWIVKRLVIVHDVVHHAICPAVYFSLLPLRFARVAPRVARTALQLGALALALTHAWHDGINYAHWTHKRYLKRALGNGRASYLSGHRARRSHYMRMIKPGSTVVIAPALAPPLVMDCPCYPLALPQAIRGVHDMPQRRADAEALVSLELDLPARIDLMRRYGVRTLVVPNNKQGNALRRLYKPMIRHQKARAGMAVFDLDLDRPLPAPVQAETTAPVPATAAP